MLLITTGYLADFATVHPFSLRSQATVAPDLLIVAKSVAFGYLGFLTSGDHAPVAAFLVLPLRSEPTVPTDLLIVARAKTGGPRFPVTAFCLANRLPSGFDNFVFHVAIHLGST